MGRSQDWLTDQQNLFKGPSSCLGQPVAARGIFSRGILKPVTGPGEMTVSQSTGPVSQPNFQDLAGQTVAIDKTKTVKAMICPTTTSQPPLIRPHTN